MSDAYCDSFVLLAPMDGLAPNLALAPDYSNGRRHLALKNHATLTAAQSRFGTSALYVDGAGDCLQSSSPNLAFGTADLTIEFWVYLIAGGHGGAYARLLQLGPNSTNGGLWIVSNSTDNPARLLVQGYTASAYVNLVATGATISNTAWHHVALTRSGATWTVWVDGAAYNTGSNGTYAVTQMALYVGANDSGGESFYGYIDDLRITSGVARYTGAFTPPGALEYAAEALATVTIAEEGHRFTHSAFAYPSQTAVSLVAVLSLYDFYSGGRGRITGTVKEHHTPDDLPVARKVRLCRERDGLLISETWSDPATGAYAFDMIDPSASYFVVAFDHHHTYRAVIADTVTPEAI